MPQRSRRRCGRRWPVGSVKDAAAEVAQTFGLPRKDVYQMALKLAEEE